MLVQLHTSCDTTAKMIDELWRWPHHVDDDYDDDDNDVDAHERYQRDYDHDHDHLIS